MNTEQHDPAWENWLKGKALRDKWHRQNEFIQKNWPTIVVLAIAVVTTTANFIFN